MKFGFDMDGTLDREPVRVIAAALLAAGHEVHVITGFHPSWIPPYPYSREAKEAKLAGFGLGGAVLHMAIGQTLPEIAAAKSHIITAQGIMSMVEDELLFAEHVRANTGAVSMFLLPWSK